jgi:hypothetical protein
MVVQIYDRRGTLILGGFAAAACIGLAITRTLE